MSWALGIQAFSSESCSESALLASYRASHNLLPYLSAP